MPWLCIDLYNMLMKTFTQSLRLTVPNKCCLIPHGNFFTLQIQICHYWNDEMQVGAQMKNNGMIYFPCTLFAHIIMWPHHKQWKLSCLDWVKYMCWTFFSQTSINMVTNKMSAIWANIGTFANINASLDTIIIFENPCSAYILVCSDESIFS